MLFLYLAVSESAVSGALICEDEGVHMLVYYFSHHEWTTNQISKARKTGARLLHHLEEAQVLLLDFPDHGPHGASPAKHYRKSKSNMTDIEMGIGAETL